jgi:tellurium resistance protein TerD
MTEATTTTQGVVNLSKGGIVNLAKQAPRLQRAKLGLAWDPNQSDTGQQFDLDASAFMLNKDGKVISSNHMIFYNNLNSPEGSVKHLGDNRTGQGDGDDESITIDLAKVPAEVTEISFIVTIDDAAARGQNFGQVRNSRITLYNADDNASVAKYELREDFSGETAVQFGSLERNSQGSWSFSAVGRGWNRGLADVVRLYGLTPG